MKYNLLGRTDIKVSRICLGTMTFGEQNTEKESHEQMSYALEKGVNIFDTAEMYAVPNKKETQGASEEIIGTWLKSTGNRDKVIIATKISGPSPGLKYIRNPLDFSKTSIINAIENSLKRLKTDYIDLYQLHWPERKTNFFGQLDYKHDRNERWEDNFLEILQALDEQIKAGKIRHIGISNESAWGMMNFTHVSKMYGLPSMATIQNPYSLLNRSFEVGGAEIAIREKMGLMAYSPLGFGVLSGKYLLKKDLPRDRINRFPQFARYNGENSRNATAQYLEIAREHNMTLAQMALAFVNDRPFMTTNIIGATTMEQLKENLSSAEIELDSDILKKINEVHKEISNPAP